MTPLELVPRIEKIHAPTLPVSPKRPASNATRPIRGHRRPDRHMEGHSCLGDIEYDLPGLRGLHRQSGPTTWPPRTPARHRGPSARLGRRVGAGELETFAEWFIRERGAA